MSEPTAQRCIFCGIVSGAIPSNQVYADERVVAFRDRNPQAPTHILVVPRKHFSGINDPAALNGELLTALVFAANEVARRDGIAESGYRLVWNVGPDAGQSVFHLHLHVLGGRPLGLASGMDL